VASATFHPKMGKCRFQNIFCARLEIFTMVLVKTEVLCGVILSHWVSEYFLLFQRVIVISSSWSGHQRMLESEVGSTKIL
jgi:hypothetical protein